MTKTNCSTINKFAFLYLYVPTIIFLWGWCKPIISIILIPLLTIILIKLFITDKKKISFKDLSKKIKENKKTIIIIAIISIIYVFFSGIGGYVFQNSDHVYRNAIMDNLVNNSWPIINQPAGDFNSQVMFVYYFAFWLPAALIGKMLGLSIGYLFLYLWSIIGMCIVFSYIRKFYKGNFLIPIIIFILFSGLDIIEAYLHGSNMLDLINSTTHIEWSSTFQFSSFTTQLFWVFNQAIPAWILTTFILSQKDNRILGVLTAISLIFCTLPAIGLSFIVLYKVFLDNGIKKRKITEWLKHTLTWENVLVGIPLLIIFATFVKSNSAGNIITFGIKQREIVDYIIAVTLEFSIYYLLIYKYQKDQPLYYISLILLLICPMISINNKGDFCMRVSIPALMILFLYIINTIEKAIKSKDKKTLYTLIIVLAIGSITPINEIKRTIANTKTIQKRESIELITCESQKNFYGYTEDSLFYKYFIKK